MLWIIDWMSALRCNCDSGCPSMSFNANPSSNASAARSYISMLSEAARSRASVCSPLMPGMVSVHGMFVKVLCLTKKSLCA